MKKVSQHADTISASSEFYFLAIELKNYPSDLEELDSFGKYR